MSEIQPAVRAIKPTRIEWVKAVLELRRLKKLGNIREADLKQLVTTMNKYKESDGIPLHSEVKAFKYLIATQVDVNVMTLSKITQYFTSLRDEADAV